MSLPNPDVTNPIVDGKGVLIPFWKKWFIELRKQVESGGSGGGSTSPLVAKGDLWGYSNVNARVPVGNNGDVLTADNATALGVKWAAPSGGGGGGGSYTTGTFTATLLGCTTAPTTTMHYLVTNNICALWLGGVSFLGVATGAGSVGFSGLPVACRAATYHAVACGPIMNNNTFAVGFAYGMNSSNVGFDTVGNVSWGGSVGLALGWTMVYPLT